MNSTPTSAARIGALSAENSDLLEAIARLRQTRVSNSEQRSARAIEIAQYSLRVQRNQLEILECQIALQEARLRRYDGVATDDRHASDTAPIVRRGLATLHRNRDAAVRRLRRAETELDRRVARYHEGRSDRAAGADQP